MDRESLFAGYREHVNAGKIDAFERYGFDAVMGKRDGIRFRDAYDPDRSWINCHCNGGVFNLGHRNPQVAGLGDVRGKGPARRHRPRRRLACKP